MLIRFFFIEHEIGGLMMMVSMGGRLETIFIELIVNKIGCTVCQHHASNLSNTRRARNTSRYPIHIMTLFRFIVEPLCPLEYPARCYVGSSLPCIGSSCCQTSALGIVCILKASVVCLTEYTATLQGFRRASVVFTVIVPVYPWSSHAWKSI